MSGKFDEAELTQANMRLKMLKFYPTDPEAQAAVMELLARMCPSREALEWLTDTMTNVVGEWKGPAELRGLLCTRFRPADGIERSCSIPGFRAEDYEARHYDQHQAIKAGAVPEELVRQLLPPGKLKRLN